MSILIKGMSGYECCEDCEFCGGLTIPDDIYTCDCPSTRGMNITRAIEEDCRHPDCQLVELPEKHGRLIDADALIADIRKNSASYFADDFAREWVDRQPIIVEAEGEE